MIRELLENTVQIDFIAEARSNRKRCMRCDAKPTVEALWADGRGRAWFCNKHFKEWKDETDREIINVKKVTDGEVGASWKENTNKPMKELSNERVTPKELHDWYLEGSKELDPDNFNDEAQVEYEDLPEPQKKLDQFIAKKVNANEAIQLGDRVKIKGEGVGEVVDIEGDTFTVDFGAQTKGFRKNELEFLRHGDKDKANAYGNVKQTYKNVQPRMRY